MEEKQLIEFINWLPTKVKELQNKSPEEIAITLNKLAKTPEGQKQLEGLITQFRREVEGQSEPGMFKKGGKLNAFVEKFQKGKKIPVKETGYVQGRTSHPVGMARLDFNKHFNDGYRASQWSNPKTGDITQLLQVPNAIGGTERRLTNNLKDTTYVNTFNGAETSNRPLPWYRPKSEKAQKKADYDRFTSRFAEYYAKGGNLKNKNKK